MRLVLGSDHAGYCLRVELANYLSAKAEVYEVGAMSTDSYDYPDASDAVACDLLEGRADLGILICGSGIGVDIRANRYAHVRAANCVTVEMAELARLHNHANVLCLGARLLQPAGAKSIVDAFLATEPSQDARHLKRVEKLDQPVC